jgi:hypothetical protein
MYQITAEEALKENQGELFRDIIRILPSGYNLDWNRLAIETLKSGNKNFLRGLWQMTPRDY